MTSKICEVCGIEYSKPANVSKIIFEKTRRYCSAACRAKAVGKINTGRKDSDETRAKKSQNMQGSLNPQFGIKKSPEVIAKLRAALREKTSGERHVFWKGAAVGYYALHKWLNKQYPRTGICEHCGRKRKTHYANLKHHNYTRNRADYAELCINCHNILDGRTKDRLGRFSGRHHG